MNINDLTITTFETPAKAILSATYPSVFNNGEPLDVITKAEILRDDSVIETITNPTLGLHCHTKTLPNPGVTPIV